MTMTIDGTAFDNVFYDEDADVLYLHVGDPATATDFAASPEGHAIRFDARGRIVGITLVSPRHLLESGEPVTITLASPERITIDAAALGAALRAA